MLNLVKKKRWRSIIKTFLRNQLQITIHKPYKSIMHCNLISFAINRNPTEKPESFPPLKKTNPFYCSQIIGGEPRLFIALYIPHQTLYSLQARYGRRSNHRGSSRLGSGNGTQGSHLLTGLCGLWSLPSIIWRLITTQRVREREEGKVLPFSTKT